jgi:radical SAM protein with 4Fe4S-binding SPASM domain
VTGSGYSDLLVRTARAAVPLEVSLELTHRCTFRCVHCYVPDFAAPDLLSTERVLSLLEELADAGTLFLTLTGGEVFLRRDWDVIARRSRALGFCLTFLTNGSLVDDAAAEVLADLPARVEVSVYALDPGVMDAITARPGSCRQARRAVELLRERGVHVVVKTPVMTLNLSGVPAVAAWAREVGAEFAAVPAIVSGKDGDPGPLAVRVPEADLREFYSGPHFDCGEVRGADEPESEDVLCAAGSRYCNITPSGDVLACNILPGSAGNVRDRGFREIWEQSPWLAKVRSIRRRDLHACRDCAEQPWCGRCPAQALVEDGDLLGPSRVACERAGVLRGIRKRAVTIARGE